MSDWTKVLFNEVADFNPRESIVKGTYAAKIGMEKLQPFCRDIAGFEILPYNGGAKFRNGDTIMARITPCLENGKVAMVGNLKKDQVGYGSTEFIVLRAKPGLMDPYFLYYLVRSSVVREPAIKSMVGSSGRQRVQIDVIQDLELNIPPIEEQIKIGNVLKLLDDKIALNAKINCNLQAQAFAVFENLLLSGNEEVELGSIAEINPRRDLKKGVLARSIDMTKLSTIGTFPDGWEYKEYSGGMKYKNGDTILARITPCLENGKVAYIDFLEDGEVAFGSTEYIVMSPKKGIPAPFLYCLARRSSFRDYAIKHMNGSSGRQRVDAESVKRYRIPILQQCEYDEFDRSVSSLFDMMRSNSLESIKLASLRDLLIPELIVNQGFGE